MRREGRQHGMVRCYDPELYLKVHKQTRVLNRFGMVPTRNGFTKVSPKPTNHSKPTTEIGCTCCQDKRLFKARAKEKRAHKGRSMDVLLNYRLAGFRLMGPTNGILEVLNEHHEDKDEDETDGEVYLARVNDHEDSMPGNGAGEEVKENGDDGKEYCSVGLGGESEEEEEYYDDWCIVKEDL